MVAGTAGPCVLEPGPAVAAAQAWAVLLGSAQRECAGNCPNSWTPGSGAERPAWAGGSLFRETVMSDPVFYILGREEKRWHSRWPQQGS